MSHTQFTGLMRTFFFFFFWCIHMQLIELITLHMEQSHQEILVLFLWFFPLLLPRIKAQ